MNVRTSCLMQGFGFWICLFVPSCISLGPSGSDHSSERDVTETSQRAAALRSPQPCERDADCVNNPEGNACVGSFAGPICGCQVNSDCNSDRICAFSVNGPFEPLCVECYDDADCRGRGNRSGCRSQVCVPGALLPEYGACSGSGGRGNCDFGLYCTQIGPASSPHCFREGPCFDVEESYMELVCTQRCASRIECPAQAPECYKAPNALGWCVPS